MEYILDIMIVIVPNGADFSESQIGITKRFDKSEFNKSEFEEYYSDQLRPKLKIDAFEVLDESKGWSTSGAYGNGTERYEVCFYVRDLWQMERSEAFERLKEYKPQLKLNLGNSYVEYESDTFGRRIRPRQ